MSRGMKDKNCFIRTITPEWAMMMLEKNKNNRNISDRTVQEYAADMAAGHWVLTHQPIAFDEAGDLIDGQHRLWAVVMSGVSIQCRVVFNVPKKQAGLYTMEAVDRHRARTVGHSLTMYHGISSGCRAAGILRGIFLFYNQGWKPPKMSTPMGVELLGLVRPSLERVMDVWGSQSVNQSGKLVSPMVIYHTVHPNKAEEFISGFSTHINLEEGSPILALDRWCKRNKMMLNTSRFEVPNAVASAIHQFHKDIKSVLLRTSEIGIDWMIDINPKLRDACKEMAGSQLKTFAAIRKAREEHERKKQKPAAARP